MNAYYTITQNFKNLFLEDEEVNKVEKGDITRINLNKKTIFPLVHINVYSAGFSTSTLEFDVNIIAMNLRDSRKQKTTDDFIGNDNEDDNLNAMLMVLLRAYLKLQKKTFDDDMELVSFERPEPFREGENNVCDGWTWRLTVSIPIQYIGAC